MKNFKKTEFIISGALIAAAYAGLTYLCNIFGISYGPIQLRLSEVLTVLPVFTPAAIPGLTVGCFLANIASFNVVDMIFGTMATFIAAVLTYYMKDIKVKNIPVLSLLSPVVINALIIGLEIAFFFLPEGSGVWGIILSSIQIGISEFIVCFVFGIPFYFVVKKYRIFEIKHKPKR